MSESKEPTTPKVTYDQHADVLYVTFADKPAARGFEDGFGRVRRYDSDDKLIGVTFIDFTKRLADLRFYGANATSPGARGTSEMSSKALCRLT